MAASAAQVASLGSEIAEIFEDMSYGPAPEADNVVQVNKVNC